MQGLNQRIVSGTDTLSPKERSERMSRVRNKDTKPEMRVRRLVHSLGYRYRLHSGKLPGRPDLVFPERRKVIFVHECLCSNAHIPALTLKVNELRIRNCSCRYLPSRTIK